MKWKRQKNIKNQIGNKMAELTDKQKQLDIDGDDKIEASDLKAVRAGALKEKLSRLAELMAEKKIREYQKESDINENLLDDSKNEQIRDTFDDFYLIVDNLITTHYGMTDLAKFREMYNLLFLKYQTKLDDIIGDLKQQ